MGFSRLKICQEDDSIDEKSGSESDIFDNVAFAQNFLEVGESIELIATTSRKQEYSRFAILTATRFIIYDIWEEISTGVEFMLRMEKNFRSDIMLKRYGKISTLDFEQDGKKFITCSNTGWIFVWSLEDRELVQHFQVINP